MSYESELVNKKYVPNVVMYFKGLYWGIRQPDSGLTIPADNLSLEQVAINPTKVDPNKANTTINSYTFKLSDKNLVVTELFNGITKFFQNEQVSIWVGRCNVNMPFSDYLKLPDTFVKSVTKDGNAYKFSATEAKDRINRPAFNDKNKLAADILVGTTEITAINTIDVSLFPASGLIKIDNEFISYASIDVVNNRFSSCIRGEKNSTVTKHDLGADIFLVVEVTANPVDIILQCLISEGGGGVYDVLIDGAGIDQSLINITKFEEIRDEFYNGHQYNLLLYGITNILTYLETQILYPNDLRIISDNNSKISLGILNRRLFDDEIDTINNNTIIKPPQYEVDDTNIVNVINVEYDFSEATKIYRKLITIEDAASIADFGKRDAITIQSKGIKEVYNGFQIAADIAQRFLYRFSYPRPEISFNTHIDKSLILLTEKTILESTDIPNDLTGELNFADTVEVIERGINWKTGDVKFRVGFTSFTGIKECYLAPSDIVTSVVTQKSINIGAGRGVFYKVGWKMRLYDNSIRDYASVQVNEIESIAGDVVNFVDNWSTTLTINHRIMFCDYDDAVYTQKKYCFISDDGLNFLDNTKSYQITL